MVTFVTRKNSVFRESYLLSKCVLGCISYDRITLNDLECPIQLKVRFTDGTLDVRLLRVSESTMRIGVARGGGGVDWRA